VQNDNFATVLLNIKNLLIERLAFKRKLVARFP